MYLAEIVLKREMVVVENRRPILFDWSWIDGNGHW